MHIGLSWRRLALVCLLLAARALERSAGIPEQLKWVRGTVVSVTSTNVPRTSEIPHSRCRSTTRRK